MSCQLNKTFAPHLKVVAAIAGIGFLFANQHGAAATETPKTGIEAEIKSVATLNHQIEKYTNKKITIHGEVDRKFGKASFVLESGDIVDDKIVVILNPKSQLDLSKIRRDERVKVRNFRKLWIES